MTSQQCGPLSDNPTALYRENYATSVDPDQTTRQSSTEGDATSVDPDQTTWQPSTEGDACSINDIPSISVVRQNGRWVTADNRRLWVFRQLERLGKCDVIPVRQTYRISAAKCTSESNGEYVHVRGSPGGWWHMQPSARKSRSTSVTWNSPSMHQHTSSNRTVRNSPMVPSYSSSNRTVRYSPSNDTVRDTGRMPVNNQTNDEDNPLYDIGMALWGFVTSAATAIWNRLT